MRVLLGMSGGLDSTFAALSLIEKGYAVEGAVLKFSDHKIGRASCRERVCLSV